MLPFEKLQPRHRIKITLFSAYLLQYFPVHCTIMKRSIGLRQLSLYKLQVVDFWCLWWGV